jgi:anti-sigma28 factor (negative regulator of flagellin synthesis)
MPYKLGSRRLALDVAWEHNGVQYPANWLRLSTAQDRAELGIIWEDASPTYNQKWYWGKDSDGNLIPKTYTDLKTLWIAKTKETANKLLQPSDWRVIKAKERGSTMNADWKTWRQTIRTECGAMVTAIEETASVGDTSPHADFGRVEALQQYIEGGTYNVWTADPDNASE